ncbi:MAG TPA: type II secretion system protein [Candidatus Elarobacter sp.]|nr:type II secretion system protein [Candidatus Elarobacter sp.]
MNSAASDKCQPGFTLVELLVSLGIFLLVIGAAFTLLGSSQNRYQTESQVLTSFQEARLGLDQIVRDVNDAGYPPPSYVGTDPTRFAITPFAWSPGYAGSISCVIGTGGGGTCVTPGDFDLIIETNPNPQDPSCPPSGCPVQWIRYQLQAPPTVQVPTLMRGAVNKPPGGGGNPDAATSAAGVLAPFVQNVVNSPAQPIFSYTCDTLATPQSAPLPCPIAAPADNFPANIRDVMINLIVATPQRDATTGQPRVVELRGRGRRINPNQ